MMEYISGVDLMRVVTKATYLNIDHVQIVMAQLILALEHLHLRGFLHRDVKVSNMLIVPGGRVKLIDFDTNKVCLGHFSKRLVKGYFARTAFEFHDGESAGTIPYMAPEILKRRPYAPLKWPKTEEHPHSATPEAKDMVFKLLRKNPIERLASRHYQDLKNHPFFGGFNWKVLSANKFICEIPAIAEAMGGGAATSAAVDEGGGREVSKKPRSSKPPSRGESPPERKEEPQLSAGATTNTKKRKLQKIEDMIDMEPDLQKPLYTYASASFKKLVLTVS
ncbi:microtubule-associated serine/threonine-protein kinase 2-like [Rhipicephalus sanguineus]|uniref:microtubule-associated serine/threonine-protein kinase 2-like n=1 Tax=Rhipicephalus sanguineus TaxID=34632 RepID=UPI001893AE8B|nr:microtubule-associated serine/threonine-protein kinase 2-like [Rhipicephalus sanguineus]